MQLIPPTTSHVLHQIVARASRGVQTVTELLDQAKYIGNAFGDPAVSFHGVLRL